MKKLLALITGVCFCFIFSGCEVSDTEIANTLEGNMTRLVYSVGYLDAISEEELSALVNGGSTYFTHSSLYTGNGLSLDASLNNDAGLDNSANGTGTLTGGLTAAITSSGRSRVYTSGLDTNINNSSKTGSLNNVSADGTTTYSGGSVDLSMLETSSADLNDILLEISQKRGIIMLYCTDLRSGKASLSLEAKEAINEYTDIIQETTAYLNNNAGDLTGHFNSISSIALNENSAELINARLIRANEVLKTRYAKLDTCLDSMSAIIDILHSSTSFNYVDLYNAGVSSYYNGTNIQTGEVGLNGGLTTDSTLSENEIEDEIIDEEMISGGIEKNEANLENNLITNDNCNCCEYNSSQYNLNNSGYNTLNNGLTYPDNVLYNQNLNNNLYNGNLYNLNNNSCCNGYNYNNNSAYGYNTSALNSNFTTPSTNGEQDNTVINYNLSGENSSSMNVNNGNLPTTGYGNTYNNTPTTLENYPAVQANLGETLPQNAPVLESNVNTSINNESLNPTEIGLNTPSLPIDNAETLKANDEVVLNGGLVRNASSNCVLFHEDLPETIKTEEGDAIRLNVVEPENKMVKEESKKNNTTTLPNLSHPSVDLREEEITESEKELTPDLLPLIGEGEVPMSGGTNSSPRPLPLNGAPELGFKSVNPIKYEDENPLMLLPRK